MQSPPLLLGQGSTYDTLQVFFCAEYGFLVEGINYNRGSSRTRRQLKSHGKVEVYNKTGCVVGRGGMKRGDWCLESNYVND